jgi:hypothetical protein
MGDAVIPCLEYDLAYLKFLMSDQGDAGSTFRTTDWRSTGRK